MQSSITLISTHSIPTPDSTKQIYFSQNQCTRFRYPTEGLNTNTAIARTNTTSVTTNVVVEPNNIYVVNDNTAIRSPTIISEDYIEADQTTKSIDEPSNTSVRSNNKAKKPSATLEVPIKNTFLQKSDIKSRPHNWICDYL